jgi:hypothetical protein
VISLESYAINYLRAATSALEDAAYFVTRSDRHDAALLHAGLTKIEADTRAHLTALTDSLSTAMVPDEMSGHATRRHGTAVDSTTSHTGSPR